MYCRQALRNQGVQSLCAVPAYVVYTEAFRTWGGLRSPSNEWEPTDPHVILRASEDHMLHLSNRDMVNEP